MICKLTWKQTQHCLERLVSILQNSTPTFFQQTGKILLFSFIIIIHQPHNAQLSHSWGTDPGNWPKWKYQRSLFCDPNPCLELLCVNHSSTRHQSSSWQLQMSQRLLLHGYCFPSIYGPCTGRRKIIHLKTSSAGNPLTLFSLSQKVHQHTSPVVSLCQNRSAELSFPDGRCILLHSRYVSLTILHYDDKHLPSWAPCTLVWVTGVVAVLPQDPIPVFTLVSQEHLLCPCILDQLTSP